MTDASLREEEFLIMSYMIIYIIDILLDGKGMPLILKINFVKVINLIGRDSSFFFLTRESLLSEIKNI